MNIVVMLLVLTVAWVLVCPPGGCAMQEFPGDPQDRGVEAPVALQDCDVRTAWKEAFHRKEARNDSGTILRSPVTGVIPLSIASLSLCRLGQALAAEYPRIGKRFHLQFYAGLL